MRAELQELINNDQSEGFEGMSVHAEVMKLRQAVTLVETQSVEALCRYFDRQRNQARSSGASKASQRMVSDPRVREAMRKAEDFDEIHPKYSKTRMLLAETLGLEGGERVIVFTESRDTAEALTEFLCESFDAKRFVGQGDREGSDGMTQNQQQEVLDEFRAGEFEVLVPPRSPRRDWTSRRSTSYSSTNPSQPRSGRFSGRGGPVASPRGGSSSSWPRTPATRPTSGSPGAARREMSRNSRDLKGMADDLADELDDSQQSLADFEATDESEAEVNDSVADPDAVGGSSSGSEGLQGSPDCRNSGPRTRKRVAMTETTPTARSKPTNRTPRARQLPSSPTSARWTRTSRATRARGVRD